MLCVRLCDPMDHSQPDSSIRGILKARILEWVAMPSFRRRSYLPDPGTEPVFHTSPALAGRFFTISATWEAKYVYAKIKDNRDKWCTVINRWKMATFFFSTLFSLTVWLKTLTWVSLDFVTILTNRTWQKSWNVGFQPQNWKDGSFHFCVLEDHLRSRRCQWNTSCFTAGRRDLQVFFWQSQWDLYFHPLLPK